MLIIITNDGGPSDYLPGVVADKEKYTNFFTSNEGGGWDSNEVLIPDTNKFSTKDLQQYVKCEEKRSHVDYWLIVFCGHGGMDNKGVTFFDFYNEDFISERKIKSMFSNSRCLLIADSCRPSPYLNLKTITESRISDGKNNQTSYRKKCQMIYNQQIERIPVGGFFRAYASSFDYGAEEISDTCGGCYSYYLIQCAKEQINKEKKNRRENLFDREICNEVFSIGYIHRNAKRMVLQSTEGRQHPEYLTARIPQPPFCVIPL